MLYIEHTPLSGTQKSDDGFEIQAEIIPYSGENLIAESTLLYWKVEDGEWNSVQMQHLTDNTYHAVIPSQVNNTKVYYYIHAEDLSGRSENHPYIGATDAHSFIVKSKSKPSKIPNMQQRQKSTTNPLFQRSIEKLIQRFPLLARLLQPEFNRLLDLR